ncbi:MAG TPA: kynureninase [Steroidobacteraceae bacterium]|nr:kynureninase [Steroidobacteraceae bacterium]
MKPNSRHFAAEELDASDPLRAAAAEFVLDDCVYLDGNSLGRMPRCVPDRLRQVADAEWGAGLVSSWLQYDWINLPARVGGRIARLVGAGADEVVVGNSTTVNLFNATACALGLTPRRRIVTDEANFPTDLYALDGLQRLLGPGLTIERVPAGDVLRAIDGNTALVLLSHIDYRTATVLDMMRITAETHRAGGLVLWDLSHSAGALPVDLNGCNVDLAVGCTYKYLNGGPGAPAFTFAARRWHEKIRPVVSGWLGHKAPFAFDPVFEPAAGIRRLLSGTPEVLALSALDASLSVFERFDIQALRAKSLQLTGLFIDQLEQRCGKYGFEIVSPRDPVRRGSHVAVAHENGYAIMQALIERRIVGDFRAPNLMRFGFAPLYQRYRDVEVCVSALEEIMRTGVWQAERFRSRAFVT